MSVREGIDTALTIGAGCLIFVVAIVAAIVIWFFAFPHEIGIARNSFPNGVTLGRTLYHEAQSGGREGCQLVVFELAEGDVERLEADAQAYLQRLGPRTPRGNALASWSETPRLHRGSAADAEGWACSNRSRDRTVFEALQAAQRPGAYYTTFNHGEGRIYLIPSRRLAVYYYFG